MSVCYFFVVVMLGSAVALLYTAPVFSLLLKFLLSDPRKIYRAGIHGGFWVDDAGEQAEVNWVFCSVGSRDATHYTASARCMTRIQLLWCFYLCGHQRVRAATTA